MVEEEFRVDTSFSLHDAAVHELALVNEDTIAIDVAVLGTLATVLPLTVSVTAVGLGRSTTWASEIATVLTRAREGVNDTSERHSAVNTGQNIAIDAIIIASLLHSDVGLAAVLRITVAVGPSIVANEDAVTAGINVGGVTVAVGVNGSGVNISGAVGQTKEEAIVGGDIPRRTAISKLITSINADSVTEVVKGLRAKVARGIARPHH
jgi:hypothetical protein